VSATHRDRHLYEVGTVPTQPPPDLQSVLDPVDLTFRFTFRAFGRRFYPKRLTKSTFVEGDSNISLWCIKIRIEQVSSIHSYEVNRTSFIIARLSA